jgi:Tfp pilus assembly protein PilO
VPPGLAEASAKGPNLQIVLGDLSLVVNLESLDDALCSDLLRSHDKEDEGQLAVQPLNVSLQGGYNVYRPEMAVYGSSNFP